MSHGRRSPSGAVHRAAVTRAARPGSRLRSIAMIAVFDIGGPLVAYSLLRAQGSGRDGADPQRRVPGRWRDHRRGPAPPDGRHRGAGSGGHPGRDRARADQPQRQAGPDRGIGANGPVRAGVPGVATDAAAADLLVRAGVRRAGYRAGAGDGGLWQYPGCPARVPRHDRGMGLRLSRRGWLRVVIVEHTSTGTALASSKIAPFIFAASWSPGRWPMAGSSGARASRWPPLCGG